MLPITDQLCIADDEIEMHAIRAQGAGGQNVNKVASAVHLRFDIQASSLPETYKQRLLQLKDRRKSAEGIIIIKAQRYRSQEKNRADAMERLKQLIQDAISVQKKRKPTRQSLASKNKRLDAKSRRGQIKTLRKTVSEE